MNNQAALTQASSLMQAMRNRWRTGRPSASLPLSAGLENAEFKQPALQSRSLSEDAMSPKLRTGCPKCGSHKIAGWMPTDFESAKCEECGKIYEPKVRENQEMESGFLRTDDMLDYFNVAWKKSGILDKKTYIRDCMVKQEIDFVNRTGTMDSHSRKIIYGESLNESAYDTQSLNDTQPDYDPSSPEPRYLQLAKAELMRRRDLKCRDCGFNGLPAKVDGNCPECGGLMDDPNEKGASAQATADQIRAAIRQQVADQVGKKQKGPKDDANDLKESDDSHMVPLITQYGFRENGDHFVHHADASNRLYVDSSAAWTHDYEGVRHEGCGYKALAAHFGRCLNSRS